MLSEALAPGPLRMLPSHISTFLPLLPLQVITARRANRSSEPDVLQSFIDARYKDGRALTDDEITGLLIAVLFAGQHTSSITR
jgi:hypothetical protein